MKEFLEIRIRRPVTARADSVVEAIYKQASLEGRSPANLTLHLLATHPKMKEILKAAKVKK